MVTRNEALAQLTAPGAPFEMIEAEALGRRVRLFKNAPPTQRDLFERARSDKPFLQYEDDAPLTYEGAWRHACALGAALVEDYGVRKGDRVAVSMRNYPEWMTAYMAISSVGAIVVAMNALWQPDEMAFGVTDSGAKVLFLDQERIDRLTASGLSLENLSIIGVRTTKPLPERSVTYDELISRRPNLDVMPPVEMDLHDDTLMLYTSGSTGFAKGAVSTHSQVISALLAWEVETQSNIKRGTIPAPKPGAPQPVALLTIPLFHVTGLHAVFLASFRYQRKIVTMYKWDAARGAELIEKYSVTNFTAPPAVTGDMVEYARKTGKTFPTLAVIGGGGAARPPEQVRSVPEVFANARPSTGWGMTELNSVGAGFTGQDYLDHPDATGRAHVVYDLRIADEDGNILGPMQRGELQVYGSAMMRGYWNNPKANAEVFTADGWLKTGDVAYIDHEGFVFIVDRIKDLIIRGGENIGCVLVESALAEHPQVLEACVYGVPDARLGEEVGATVYVEGEVTPDELRQFLEGRIAKFSIPRYIEIEHEPLLRGPTGKIFKRQLRDDFAKRMAAEAAT